MAEEQIVPEEKSTKQTDSSLAPAVAIQPTVPTENLPAVPKIPLDLSIDLNIFLGQNGKAYVEMGDYGNPRALMVGGRQLNNLIRSAAQLQGKMLRKRDLDEINETLRAHAETANIIKNVWNRVAPIDGGIEVDLGDDQHTRIRITAGKVELITEGSEVIFFRPPLSMTMAMPAESGDLNLIKKYINMSPVEQVLLIGWISYTLAHPKISTSKYVILALMGGQGSGKSSLCNIISKLIDPSQIGVQTMPKNGKDLAIATQGSHVLFYDNIRNIANIMSDLLCTTATGGATASRKLYSDDEQTLLRLHAALVLNGIHSFLEQPDLSQRSLPLRMRAIEEQDRKSDAEMMKELEADLPAIMRGLFDLIAEIFKHLPDVEVTYPERMIDFSRWLAAIEKAQDIPAGIYQREYSNVLNQGQLDALMDNSLAAAVIEFADKIDDGEWTGTPAEILYELDMLTTLRTLKSRDWPLNPIALSKRLLPLQAGLLTQGISIEFTRGKYRTITLTTTKKD